MVEPAFEAAGEQWRTEGWVLLDGLISPSEIAPAQDEIADLQEVQPTGPTRRADEVGSDPKFRDAQFDGTTLFPLPKSPRLNRLFVHPGIVEFAKAAMQTDDVRLYQSRLWSKRGGHTNYEQPLHRDSNHSLVPIRSESTYWFMETFLYLSDVDEGNGAPRIVSRSNSLDEPAARGSVRADDQPQLYAAEVAAPGPAGSLLAYRSDVWHRGTDIEEGRQRHIAVLGFRPAELDWVGFDAHPPLVNSPDFIEFVEHSTPQELALFGIPQPGHSYWTRRTIADMALIYPGLNMTPWREGLTTSETG